MRENGVCVRQHRRSISHSPAQRCAIPGQLSTPGGQALNALLDAHPGQTILAVTHGGIIAYALSEFLGNGQPDWDRWEPPNCALTVLDRDESGDWHGVLVNSIEHLSEV